LTTESLVHVRTPHSWGVRPLRKYLGSGRIGAGWYLASLTLVIAVLMPLQSLLGHAMQGSGELWPHLLAYVLPQALQDSALLLIGVGLLVISLGSSLAWLVSAYDFVGRRVLSWALLLPLAIPSYIIAFAYLDLWHPVGILQSSLRALMGFDSPRDFQLPDIRSMWGCCLLLGLVLYPYVYLPVRAVFSMQAGNLIEAARTLQAGPQRIFFGLALPLARPAIAVGASLALMEALNDLGASEFLGVRTLTVSIYSTWLNRSNLPGAAQIALLMLCIVLALISVERWARCHQRYNLAARRMQPLARRRLKGWRGMLALAYCSLPITLGFVMPAGYLVSETYQRLRFNGLDFSLLGELMNTLQLAAMTTVMAALLAFLLSFTQRMTQTPWSRQILRCASLGYAIPGTVLAIGLLGPLAQLDAWINDMFEFVGRAPIGLILSGSSIALVYAYLVRFLAIANGSLEAGFSQLPGSLDDAARTLGSTPARLAWRIHLPLCRPALLSAMLLVFVDSMKELPATLLLRPMNFETLATHLYGEAARGTYESGAMAALLIVLAGLLPIIALSRMSERSSSQ
jgi:iron(III) transport system permease protein